MEPYDLYIWSDEGTFRLARGPAWEGATSRGEAASLKLTRDGFVNERDMASGPPAKRGRYVGTVYDGKVWCLHRLER